MQNTHIFKNRTDIGSDEQYASGRFASHVEGRTWESTAAKKTLWSRAAPTVPYVRLTVTTGFHNMPRSDGPTTTTDGVQLQPPDRWRSCVVCGGGGGVDGRRAYVLLPVLLLRQRRRRRETNDCGEHNTRDRRSSAVAAANCDYGKNVSDKGTAAFDRKNGFSVRRTCSPLTHTHPHGRGVVYKTVAVVCRMV